MLRGVAESVSQCSMSNGPMPKSPFVYYLLALGVILLDQSTKYLVHRHMLMGPAGEIPLLGDWFKLHYTLNPGMAFGVELGSIYGKLILTTFRLLAMLGIGWYLYHLWKHHAHRGLLWCGGLILGGAIGNLIDSLFYGLWYNNAPFGAPMKPFYGQVIDMVYLDLYQGTLPHWLPLIGGTPLALWPIFNVADSAIFLGVTLILLNQQRFFPHGHLTPDTPAAASMTPTEEPSVQRTEAG